MESEKTKTITDFEIEQISSKTNDYDSFLSLEKEYRIKKQQRKYTLLVTAMALYSTVALGGLLLLRNNTVTRFLSWPFVSQTENEEGYNILKKEISDLDKKVSLIQLSSTTKNMPLSALNSQIESLSEKQKVIEDTIMVSPEKALTATLLREKQKNLEESFIELKESQLRLESKVDSFITTVILTPIITALVGWLIQRKFKKED